MSRSSPSWDCWFSSFYLPSILAKDENKNVRKDLKGENEGLKISGRPGCWHPKELWSRIGFPWLSKLLSRLVYLWNYTFLQLIQLYTVVFFICSNFSPADVAMFDNFATIWAAVIDSLIEKNVFIAASESGWTCMCKGFSIWKLTTALALFLGHWIQGWTPVKNCALQMDLEFKNSFHKYGPGRSQFVPGTAKNESDIFQIGIGTKIGPTVTVNLRIGRGWSVLDILGEKWRSLGALGPTVKMWVRLIRLKLTQSTLRRENVNHLCVYLNVNFRCAFWHEITKREFLKILKIWNCLEKFFCHVSRA